jgi:hypothetical protein
MQTLSAEFEVELDPQQAWERLRDFSVPDRYVQGLTRVEMTTAPREGIGASRRVTQGKSIVLDETITEWREGQGFTLRLHRGEKGAMPPFKEHFFEYGIVQREGKTFLHNSMHYSLGMGWLGRMLDALFLKRVIARQMRDVTLAQKIYYETGDTVTPEILTAARARLGH